MEGPHEGICCSFGKVEERVVTYREIRFSGLQMNRWTYEEGTDWPIPTVSWVHYEGHNGLFVRNYNLWRLGEAMNKIFFAQDALYAKLY